MGVKDDVKLHAQYCYNYNVKLSPANICDEHFGLLIELSGIRSHKIILALRDHLVNGYSRREACERHEVSLSYFSISLKKISYINGVSAIISEYYRNV
ncbi:adhesin biosynthesis transcription regulatory family protein [Escherichia coli]|uniref:adhesin biosynthesis transcription regulatory family protein n=1 Tax=Escherichia coli TaxID=562 RepID=UPI002096A1AB|nr:adhesin biosynthesis transcription regulatory family protein [Escherichia coli]